MVTFADADWRTVNMEIAAREIQKARMYFIIAQKTNTWHLIVKYIRLRMHLPKNEGGKSRRKSLKIYMAQDKIKIHRSLSLKVFVLNTLGS